MDLQRRQALRREQKRQSFRSELDEMWLVENIDNVFVGGRA